MTDPHDSLPSDLIWHVTEGHRADSDGDACDDPIVMVDLHDATAAGYHLVREGEVPPWMEEVGIAPDYDDSPLTEWHSLYRVKETDG